MCLAPSGSLSMAFSRMRMREMRPSLVSMNKFFAFDLLVASTIELPGSRIAQGRTPFTNLGSNGWCEKYWGNRGRRFSSGIGVKMPSCAGLSQDVLVGKLEIALKENEVEAAMSAFYDFRRLHGYPVVSTMTRLIKLMSYSSDNRWLEAATQLVFAMTRRKMDIVHHDVMMRLCLSLSRAQMPVPASRILRLMLRRLSLPPDDVLNSVMMHMVKTDVGTCLTFNILIEICDCFHSLRVKNPELAATLKPGTVVFNLILDACVKIGSSLKGKEVMETMARIGVAGDAHSVLLFARVCEMNFERDELKKFKDHIDEVPSTLVYHYRQYYGSLLSLHCKFDDVDAVASLVNDAYKSSESRPAHEKKHHTKACTVHFGSKYLREGLKFQIMPALLEKDSVLYVEDEQGLFQSKDGKLCLSDKGVAQVMLCYRRNGRISDLSKLFVGIQTRPAMSGADNLCIDVVDACIHVGWLEAAHDIVDDMESAGSPLPSSTYLSLLRAYSRKNMLKEAKALLTQIRRLGLFPYLPTEMDVTQFVSEVAYTNGPNTDPANRKCTLAECLVREMDADDSIPSKLHELNSAVYFFCKAKMIEDALKTYRRMQALNVKPSDQTFAYLIQGYSSLGMYREVTILWGDMKRNMENGYLLVGRDLYELLLLNFIRGGYFGRVWEVIHFSRENGMFIDKWMCKKEFLKYHSKLYRGLSEIDAKDEVQRQRIEHVKAFRKWLASN